MCCTLQVRVLECSSKTFVHAWLTGKEGLVIDERTNGGGCVADYVLDMLARYPYGYFNRRDHKAYPVRRQTISPLAVERSTSSNGGFHTHLR